MLTRRPIHSLKLKGSLAKASAESSSGHAALCASEVESAGEPSSQLDEGSPPVQPASDCTTAGACLSQPQLQISMPLNNLPKQPCSNSAQWFSDVLKQLMQPRSKRVSRCRLIDASIPGGPCARPRPAANPLRPAPGGPSPGLARKPSPGPCGPIGPVMRQSSNHSIDL